MITDATLFGAFLNPSQNILSKTINLLAIDTATDACSVALCFNGSIIEHYELAPCAHTARLLPMIDKLLKETNITFAELDLFAFGCGPGSFTGVRIATSVIQAFGFGLNKPIVPVSTLRALAQRAYLENGSRQVFAHLDARMSEIYWGLFEIDTQGIMQSVLPECVQPANEVKYPNDLFQSVTGYPHAKDIALIAASEYGLGQMVSAADALPVYLRDEVAKRNLS
jgi:tRNA threonylcarbamoyladenosine biosynthesis protein TsaB